MTIQISEEAKIKYLERRRKDIVDCHNAIKSLDFKFLQNLGHQLKGSAVTFGHQKLTDLGEVLEAKAFEKDLEAVKSIINDFEKYLAQLD